MSESEYYKLTKPLRRDGTSQKQRQLDALDPDFIKIDERTLQDFLVFAKDFARQVYYYNDNNQIDGNWEDFWTYDLSVIIASIEKTNPYDDKQRFFKIQESEPTVEGLAQLLGVLLDIAVKLDRWWLNLQQGNELKELISRLVRANLGTFLQQIAAYDKKAYQELSSHLYPEPDEERYTALSSLWNLGEFSEIDPDVNFFRQLWVPSFSEEPPPSYTDEEKLSIAYEKLKDSFNLVYNVYFQIIRQSASFFDKSLLTSDHEPYIALFIGFLKLYQQIQEDLNKITEKHLDYYYKEVLQLKTKPAVPDKVNVYLTLAKHIEEHKLDKNIRFLAGKDDTGEDLFYALDNELVINKAQLDTLHTIFVERDPETGMKVYAAPVANSADGLGAEIEDEDKPSWMTFGSNEMPVAKVGFAIASNELLLDEGARTINLTIEHSVLDLPDSLSRDAFDIWFSGEEGWFQSANVPGFSIDSNSKFILTITLSSGEPAVVPFDEEIMEEKLGTQLPVMKVMVNQSAISSSESVMDILKDIELTSFDLNITVSGLTSVLLFSDLGQLDPTKSFLPFGPTPAVGSSFYVGSKEAFQKKLTDVTISTTWENLPKSGESLNFIDHYQCYEERPDSEPYYSCDPVIVKSKGETQLTSTALFGNQETDIEGNQIPDRYKLIFSDPELSCMVATSELDDYGVSAEFGFLKLSLVQDFGHEQYANVLSRQMIASAWLPDGKYSPGAWYRVREKNNINNISIRQWEMGDETNYDALLVLMPNEPYTPTVKSITLDYLSKVTLDIAGNTNTQFIHIHPFDNTYQSFETLNKTPLIPQYQKNTSAYSSVDLEGTLMLGFTDLKPKQSLSLLFQVAENTANAEEEEATLKWQFLSNNNWVDFEEYEITGDSTKGLITSGIITFTIPDANTADNTILPNNFFWLRSWVEKNSTSVSEMINIHTQAAQLTFQDNNNDPNHLSKPLPAGTIGKLENDDSAIDSINQDYDSFGGRMAEEPLMFYTRISELLRHKGRAVTLYDYERLVLEQFPDIYKAKCINHTNEYDQIAPGHVLIAVIPDFTKMKAVDRRQPKVTRSRLDEIMKYLENLNTSFVGTFSDSGNSMKYLHVVNPTYPKIMINFQVRFKPEITAIAFHKLKLQQAIIHYLSPWAYDDGAEINFGGKVFKSSILDFVEDQDYVEYVTEFKMMSRSSADVEYIETDTARAILVPDEENIEIADISDADHCPAENSISGDTLGYLTINDFTVNNDN